MIPKTYYLLISENIKNRKMRAFLTVLGVIIGVMIIILLFSLGTAMQNGVEEQFAKTGIKSIRVVPGSLFGAPSGPTGLPKTLKENIESVRGVDYANPTLMDSANVQYNKETKFSTITSYDISLGNKAFLDTDVTVDIGRYFKPSDKDVAIIGSSVAEKLFKKKINVNSNIIINNRKFRVIGILTKTGAAVDDRITIPLDTSRELFNKQDITNAFVVQIKDGYNITAVADDINAELYKKFKDKDAYAVFTPEQLLKQIKSILGVIQAVLVAIAAISLVVGAIGIMNSMFTSVLERTRDIGVMRAIGATKKDVLLLFLIESGSIGIIGGLIGIIIGVSIAYLVNVIVASLGFSLIKVTVGLNLILFALFFSFMVGIISGLIPAIRAANLQPVDALRYE